MRLIRAVCNLGFILLLAGCAGGQCPAVKKYSKADQQTIAADYAKVHPATQSFLNEAERMRAACR